MLFFYVLFFSISINTDIKIYAMFSMKIKFKDFDSSFVGKVCQLFFTNWIIMKIYLTASRVRRLPHCCKGSTKGLFRYDFFNFRDVLGPPPSKSLSSLNHQNEFTHLFDTYLYVKEYYLYSGAKYD